MKTKPFKNLLDKMPLDAREEADKISADLLKQMPLQELRKALSLTQVQVAETLEMSQTAVSKIESQTDMYVSTLRRFIAAMGGELRVVASFPHGEIEISQFSLDDKEAA